jgi:hypothetical protein
LKQDYLKQYVFYIFFISLFLGVLSFKNHNPTDFGNANVNLDKDTIKAVVSYGDDYLFETAVDFASLDFQGRIDSLFMLDSITPGIRTEIEFYKTVANKSEYEIYLMVDSLFELDSVPFALINQINLFAALMPGQIELPDKFHFIEDDGSPYPANTYYCDHWKSRASWSYPDSIRKNDSIIVLKLADSKMGQKYEHPLSQKTLRRYYGWVTSPFGWRDGRAHNGVDLELHLYDSILNMFDGKVRVASTLGGFGRVVIVRHNNGLESLYAHMSRLKVKTGDTVVAGQLLGLGGASGNASGTHLHLETRFKGLPVNPAHIISFSDKELYSDTLILKKSGSRYVAFPYGKEFHIVKRGESPNRIAKRYGMDLKELMTLNNYTASTRLIVGQKVKIKNFKY